MEDVLSILFLIVIAVVNLWLKSQKKKREREKQQAPPKNKRPAPVSGDAEETIKEAWRDLFEEIGQGGAEEVEKSPDEDVVEPPAKSYEQVFNEEYRQKPSTRAIDSDPNIAYSEGMSVEEHEHKLHMKQAAKNLWHIDASNAYVGKNKTAKKRKYINAKSIIIAEAILNRPYK